MTQTMTLAEALFEALPVPALIHDAELALAANSAARSILEADSPADIDGVPLSRFVHPDGREAGEVRRRIVGQHGDRLFGAPVKLVGLKGTVHQLRGAAAAFTHGGANHTVVTTTDVPTDFCAGGCDYELPYADADTPLAAAALDAFPLPVLSVCDYRIAYANHAACYMLKAAGPSAVCDHLVTDILHPDVRVAVMALFRMAFDLKGTERRFKALAFDGTPIETEGTGRFVNHDSHTYGLWVSTKLTSPVRPRS